MNGSISKRVLSTKYSTNMHADGFKFICIIFNLVIKTNFDWESFLIFIKCLLKFPYKVINLKFLFPRVQAFVSFVFIKSKKKGIRLIWDGILVCTQVWLSKSRERFGLLRPLSDFFFNSKGFCLFEHKCAENTGLPLRNWVLKPVNLKNKLKNTFDWK